MRKKTDNVDIVVAVVVVRTFQCIIALVTLAHCCSCLQVASLQQQAAAAAAESSAVMAMQQQHQSLMKTLPDGQANGASGNQLVANSKQQAASATAGVAKSNHRLVSKLKDARHRRRHRHHRHRHYHHLAEKSGQALMASSEPQQQQQQQAATTLTALESIVEEVARAGQLQSPVSGQQQQQAQQQQQQVATSVSQQQQAAAAQQPQLSSAVTSGADLLLDGLSSPMTRLQQQPSQQQQTILSQQIPSQNQNTNQQQQQQQQQQNQVSVQSTRAPAFNSRGFFLTSMLSKIMNVLNVTEFALEMRDGISSRASCMACNAVVGLFLSPLYSKEVFSMAIRTVCTSFKIQSARVCSGLAESFQDDFEFIRKNTKLTRDEICAVVFGVDCARRQTYNLFWTVPIPPPVALPSKPPASGMTITDQSTGLSIPLSEQSLGNMDDAPDLFEYRKSSAGAAVAASGTAVAPTSANINSNNNNNKLDKQTNSAIATSASTTAPANQQQKPAQDSQQQQQRVSSKSGKLLERAQYIFDDDLLDKQESGDSERTANKISTFVHITDIHIDPYYEAGSLNDCNEPLCCRATSGPVTPGDKRRQAGRWGDYGNCDTPVQMLHNALSRIRDQHSNAEYWLWTGDISPHDIWNQSKAEAMSHVRLVSKMVREFSNGLPVFPVIGNHEAHPVNSFSPPEIRGKFSMSWLYDLLADEWSDWLPKEALETLRVGGYYKLHVRKGFRILALNTNYCARLNPWSLFDPIDPANQLKWLADELLEAELNQDKVHIVGHVPPDNRECTQAWLFNFINICDRFKGTILAQFYGHTHRDEWRIIYSLKPPEEPIGIQYIGPSITPFTENNPAYRVYHQDKLGHLLDSETFYFNLTEANETPTSEPNWKFSYSTRAHLNMTQGLTPAEWHQYLQKLHDDEEAFDSFFKNFYRYSEVKQGQVCKSKCKYQMLSDLRLSHPYKTKPKPFLANRKTSNHHRDHRHEHHHHHHKRLRHSD